MFGAFEKGPVRELIVALTLQRLKIVRRNELGIVEGLAPCFTLEERLGTIYSNGSLGIIVAISNLLRTSLRS